MDYIGANETTQFPVTIFFAIMAQNPDVQGKAQDELDQYLDHRLPDFDDQPHLLYITAVMLETLRWEPIDPLSLARSLDSDNEFRRYYLPKGSIVFHNVWYSFQFLLVNHTRLTHATAILRNETVFPEPR
ncbi:cytochrome P450 [Pleurotus eryngii]|uniref:Cytochrome P450 n=1 Tax=Pleurotus eryngii TaxID=5323 RepID=A0A9P5ZPB3_PLEER|nr:cytochrome P450 [Pleurotus eryngii]